MALTFDTLPALMAHGFDSVIDVRSPAEFAEDHIPGAISLPALSNDERAAVGTIYTRESPFRARKVGAALVARNAAGHIEGPLADKDGGWRPLVYCWRGGQRSGSFASILAQIGWRTDTIAGGYRSLSADGGGDAARHRTAAPAGAARRQYRDRKDRPCWLASARAGCRCWTWKGLARHRGSLFGAMRRAAGAEDASRPASRRALIAADPAPGAGGRGRKLEGRRSDRAAVALGSDVRRAPGPGRGAAGGAGGLPDAGLRRYHRRRGAAGGDTRRAAALRRGSRPSGRVAGAGGARLVWRPGGRADAAPL